MGISPMDSSPKGSSRNGQFPLFPRRTVPRTDISLNGHFPESHLLVYLNLYYRWYTKVTEANEFQQKII